MSLSRKDTFTLTRNGRDIALTQKDIDNLKNLSKELQDKIEKAHEEAEHKMFQIADSEPDPKYKGMVWMKLGQANPRPPYERGIVSCQIWNGNNWEPYKFTENVIADHVFGKIIYGGEFYGADWDGKESSFQVDKNGNIKGATITGSQINGNSINGGSINGSTFQLTEKSWFDQNQDATKFFHPWTFSNMDAHIRDGYFQTTASHGSVKVQDYKDPKVIHNWKFKDMHATLTPSYLKLTGDSLQNGTHKRTYLGCNEIWTTGTVYSEQTAKASRLSLKTNVAYLDPKKALSVINKADIYTYNFKNQLAAGNGKKQASIIIDDVHSKPQYRAPKEFVTQDGKFRDDSVALGYAISAIQQLTSEVNTLKSEIKVLKKGDSKQHE